MIDSDYLQPARSPQVPQKWIPTLLSERDRQTERERDRARERDREREG
jgi:hypothetical protein